MTKNHIWVIEARVIGGQWFPLVYPVMGRPPIIVTKREALKNARNMYHENVLNSRYFDGTVLLPACEYRVRRYVRQTED